MHDAAHTVRCPCAAPIEVDCAPVRLVADRKLGEDIRHRGRIEQRLHDTAARLDQTADAVGEVIRQAMRVERVLDHCQHPLLQLLARACSRLFTVGTESPRNAAMS